MFPIDPKSLRIEPRQAAELGASLHSQYASAKPYPNILIDNFLPVELADAMLSAFPNEGAAETFNRAQERLKRAFLPEQMLDLPRQVFYTLNSLPFIKFLEGLTGIKGLIPDPYFLGGGFHEVMNGGHLDIHADFNFHPPLGLERRINVLVYLNKDWRPEYGGQFEIWNNNMTAKVQSVEPIFNRCVVFNTSSNSFHGNPVPVSHPNGTSRKSIALYYYTATWDAAKKRHSTKFRARPGTADEKDYAVMVREFIRDLAPPLLVRVAKNVRHRVKH